MKLRAVDFSSNGRGELRGTLIAMADDGELLGLEHSGNFSSLTVQDRFIRALKDVGVPGDVARAAMATALKEIRKAVEAAAGDGVAQDGGDTARKDPGGGGSTEDLAITKALANEIGAQNHFAQDVGERLYHYENGVYVPNGSPFIKREVKRLLEQWATPELWTSHQAGEVVEYIRVDSPVLWERPPARTLDVLNGLLDMNPKVLTPHSPSFLSSVQLPISYDPEATCPAIDKFIREVFPDDAQDIAYEIPGVAMVAGEGKAKAVLAIGPGGNGKSAYLAMLKAFLGRRNTVAVSLHRLEQDRFAVSRLVGKLANICPDLPSEHLVGTSVFKAITGDDSLFGEYKYKDSFDFDPFCILIFSANNPPKSGDSSQGFFDRWVVIPFTQLFRGTEGEIPRSLLDAMLSQPRELSGLLNKALDGLDRFRRANSRFTISPTMVEAYNEFRGVTDPLAVWLEANTIDQADAFVVNTDLFQAYNSDAKRDGHQVMTTTSFGTALRIIKPKILRRQRTVGGVLQWGWVGLGLKSYVEG
jgi:putative DNA primase/helicase